MNPKCYDDTGHVNEIFTDVMSTEAKLQYLTWLERMNTLMHML